MNANTERELNALADKLEHLLKGSASFTNGEEGQPNPDIVRKALQSTPAGRAVLRERGEPERPEPTALKEERLRALRAAQEARERGKRR